MGKLHCMMCPQEQIKVLEASLQEQLAATTSLRAQLAAASSFAAGQSEAASKVIQH
jgi:hypothetical protein